MVLLPFYKKLRQVYPIWCSRLHNHTLFIKQLCKTFGDPSKFWRGPDPPTPHWLHPCAQIWFTQCYLQITPYLPLPVSIPGRRHHAYTTANAWVNLTTHLSTPRGWMAELVMLADKQWTVYSEEVTRQLHVMAQGRKSSLVIDWRSNHCATLPTSSPSIGPGSDPGVQTVSTKVTF